MRTINVNTITENIKDMCIQANHFLADDMDKAMKHALETEEAPLGRQILDQLQDNLKIAAEDMIPICQDTGMAVVFLEIPCGYSSDRFCSRTCHSCDGVDDLHYSRKLYVLCFSKRNLVSAGSFSVRISRSDQPQTCFDTGSVDELSDVIFHMDRVGDRRLDGFSCGMVEDAFLLSDRMRRRVCGRTICYDHFIYE